MKEEKVLIVVDMQNGFINDENRYLIDKINGILDNYDKVIFTKFINSDDGLYVKNLNWFGMQTEPEQQIATNIPTNSLICTKFGYGFGLDDIKKIKELNLKSVDICGVETDACVLAVAFQMFDINVFPNILINYTYSPLGNKNIVNILNRQFNSVDTKK